VGATPNIVIKTLSRKAFPITIASDADLPGIAYMLRLFAALALPPDIGAGLLRRQQGLDEARWRPLEALHITLRFFGEVREDVARDLDGELAGVAVGALDLELEGVGAFGEGPDIHAIWAGVAENPRLRRLARGCETAARRAGLKPETRTYKPHVTLAYLRRPNPDDVARWIQANNLLKSPGFRAEAFGLYSSWRTKEGSAYRLEAEYPL
jgi:2'-5' RNA ligase